MIAEVIINSTVKNLNKTFDYQVPKHLLEKVKIGSRVCIPFGNAKALEEGFVIGFKEISEYHIKEISSVQEGFELSIWQIELAIWMAKRYFCNIVDAIKMMLPPGTSTKLQENRVKEKIQKFVYLKKEPEELQDLLDQKKIKSDKQIRALQFLKEYNGILTSDLEGFADISRAVLQTLEKNGYVEIIEKQVERNPFFHKQIPRDEKLRLTKEQKKAFEEVVNAMEQKQYEQFLLYGVTGSGKTEVYLQLIERTINAGKCAIMLVPEISLTPQMVDRFIARFGEEKLAVLHSKLSLGERYDQWKRIKQKEARIIIGARSAIFAPVEDLGLLVIDEEHDSSYKSEMTPRYHAKEIARYLAKERKIPLLLGSATPDVTTFYEAKMGECKLLTLTKRANDSALPTVEIVDLREELANGNRNMLSVYLQQEILKNLNQKRQTILFLNRRGYSTFVMCRDCGYTVKCKNCDITLTYHLKENRLKCHYCGEEQENVTVCPQCGSHKVKYFGTGTQKLEAQIQAMFPQATTIRMDFDTVTKKNSHEEILSRFKQENIDILIGTQMVVKGHHFPNVTLVGVIAADSSLNLEDYRASERTFQILTQVAGRAGREHLPGKVLIQTYNPDNFSIQCAKEQNYEAFFQTEIKLRKQLKYPPFCDIMVIGISAEEEELIQRTANQLYQEINNRLKDQQEFYLFRPIPAPIQKIKNRYRWRMILKGVLQDEILARIHSALDMVYKKCSNKVRVVVDINPTSML